MGFAALITWFAAVLAGLYMFTVWLIENDVSARHTTPSQLPVPVIFAHLVLAVTGLVVWVSYLILDREALAWTAFGLLCVIALLGITMFARWIPVYRDPATAGGPSQVQAQTHTVSIWADTRVVPAQAEVRVVPAQAEVRAVPAQAEVRAVPAERNFPIAVVVSHGLLAGSTLVLVFLTALGVSGS